MAPVSVWVYDLSNGMVEKMAKEVLGIDIKGIWHTSVVVYGSEYYFRDGIQKDIPGTTHFGMPVEKIDFGHTEKTEDELEAYLEQNKDVYTYHTYDLFDHNCNHFSDAIVSFLVNKSVPAYIMDLSRMFQNTPIGEMIRIMMANTRRQ